MNKGEAWQKWWRETHGQNMPMGSYHPMEGAIYDAWSAGYEEAEKEIAYLKAQLLRVGNQEKVIKEAYLAGQMSK